MTPAVVLGRDDFWRRTAAALSDSVPYKEWHHFIVVVDQLCLLINFSIDSSSARLVVMGTTPEWYGAVDTFPLTDARFSRRGTALDVGPHQLTIHDDHHHVVVRGDDLDLDLRFRPRCEPMIAREHPVGGGRRLSWLICPTMSVSGRITVGGRDKDMGQAVGYHDHNWGCFAWGDDFAWEWGIVLPDDPRASWAVVLSSLQNRARTVTTLEQLLVWHEGQNVLALSNADLRIVAEGRRRADDGCTVPPVMLLAGARGHGDVPQRLCVNGGRDQSEIELVIDVTDHARLVVPSERDPLGTVSIFECIGTANLQVALKDRDFGGRGRCVFELVRNG